MLFGAAMAFVPVWFDRCGSCGAPYDCHLLGVSSRLGPPSGRCLKCARFMRSERVEWSELGAAGQLRFAVVSAIYAVLLACIGANFLFGIHRMRLGKYPESDPFRFGDPLFVRLALACALATLLLQAARVALSIRRTHGRAEESVATLLAPNLNFGLQLKVLAVLCVAYFGADVVLR